LAPLSVETHRGLRAMAAAVVRAAAPDLDDGATEVEADRLHALVDGLALHGVLHPEDVTPDRARAALRAHLEQLARG
jgi:hypothetical protein